MSFGNFVKNILGFSPAGWISKGISRVFGKNDGVFSSLGSFLGNIDFNEQLGSLVNTISGAHLTGSQIEANEMNMQNAEDIYQRQVSGMQSAGLNPALMYDKGVSGSVSAAPTNSASASLSDLLQLAMLPLQRKLVSSQVEATDAESDLRRSQARLASEQAENTQVSTSFAKETFELRKQSLQYANELSRAEKDLIYQRKDESLVNMRKLESDKDVSDATAILRRMEAYDIVVMQPYKIQLSQAQTAAQKAQAALSAVSEAYQRKLVDSNYVDALIRQINAQAGSDENQQVISGVTAKIKGGNVLEPADFGDSRVASVLENVWNGLVTESINNGVSVIANLLDYMPPILFTPKAPTDAYVDSSTHSYDALGNLKGTSVTSTHSYK